MSNDLFKNAIGFTKNPLGIIGLLLVTVYGISTLAFSLQSLEGWHLSALLMFNIGYPIISLITLCFLVVWHHEKLYSPLDFKNPESFENLVKLKLQKVEKEIDQTITLELKKSLEKMEESIGYELEVLKCSLNFDASDLKSAEGNIDRALKYKSTPSALAWKAYLRRRMDDLEGALFYINKAIESPTGVVKASYYYNRACYKSVLNISSNEILSDIDSAIKIDGTLLADVMVDDDLVNVRATPEFESLAAHNADR